MTSEQAENFGMGLEGRLQMITGKKKLSTLLFGINF